MSKWTHYCKVHIRMFWACHFYIQLHALNTTLTLVADQSDSIWKVVDSKFLQTMRAISIVVFLVAVASVTNLTSSAAIKRENSKGNQYPWYYWNMDGEQQWQYPPYYMRCGAEGISSLNVLSVSVVGLAALAFTGIPQALRTQ